MKKPSDRHKWILDYINKKAEAKTVNILYEDFVNEYIKEFDPKYRPTMYGANKCPQLGRDLSKMFEDGLLSRTVMGISAVAVWGFPKWVYAYTNKDND